MTTKVYVMLSGGMASAALLHRSIYSYGVENVEAIHVAIETEWDGSQAEKAIAAEMISINAKVKCVVFRVISDTSHSRGLRTYDTGAIMNIAAMCVYDQLQPDEQTFLYTGHHPGGAVGRNCRDRSKEFLLKTREAILLGTNSQVEVAYPFIDNGLHEIVSLGNNHNIDWTRTWSCDHPGRIHCGECDSCWLRKDAFQALHMHDPTEYLI